MGKIFTVGLIVIVAVLFIILGLFFSKKEKKKKQNCTAMIKGKVVRYNFRQPPTPVVQYIVNGIEYSKSFEYTAVITKSGPRKPAKSSFEDVLDNVLRIYNSSIASYTTLKEFFSIGSEMDVYYWPDKPEISYVQRYARKIISDVFISMGIFILILALAIFMLLLVNETIGLILLFFIMFVVLPACIVCPLLRGTRKKNKK